MKRVATQGKVYFTDFSVKYGKRTVLDVPADGFELSGQTIGLFGPNGAGKTTMIRTLAGLINRFGGTVGAPSPDAISYVPDEPYLYPFLDIKQCVNLFANRYPDFNQEKSLSLVRELNLPLDRPLSSFSKGQTEQAHLILSLSRGCPLYVLDEPLASVDPFTRDKLLSIIQKSTSKNSTVLMSTHIIAEIEGIFSHVIMINNGRIIANDSVEQFKKESDTLERAFKDRMAR
ncbi:ABC transporter, ATP-binding protein [Bifidobacterium bohemicum DSM 22767]|uniref:ABC transporter, ATP-binding protein n=2 Tax=Bifidobacterium bohemicum TaxID=638617 RepID=A0A086ZJX3_9BIFI|nr:ABC transporter, ATP-binding protein [Bifidobacterium bohemicum DSM 22767]